MVWIVFFVLTLLLFSRVVEYFTISYYERHADEISSRTSIENLKSVESAFNSLQRHTRRIAASLVQRPALLHYLTTDSADRSTVFHNLADVAKEHDLGVEIFDRYGVLVAWAGRTAPRRSEDVDSALHGRLVSNVTRTQVFSQLHVAMPIRSANRIVGALLLWQPIEVNYPLNNRFINSTGLADQVSRSLGIGVELDFAGDRSRTRDEKYVSAILYGLDSSRVGIARITLPSPESMMERVSQGFQKFNSLILTLLVFLLTVIGLRSITMLQSVLLQALLLSVLLWVARYALLLLDFPGLFFSGSIFDPAYYASKFGGGLGKSISEFSLTALTLLLNVVLAGKAVLYHRRPRWFPSRLSVKIILTVLAVTLAVLLLRGYAATIRSAVYDSSLQYTDSAVIVPSFELGFMLFALLLMSLSLVLVSVWLASFVIHLMSRGKQQPMTRPLLLSSAMFAVGAVTATTIQPNPLLPLEFQLTYAAGILLLAGVFRKRQAREMPLLSFQTILMIFGFASILFYAVLDDKVHERDRDKVEAFAQYVLKPVDGWVSFIVNETLQHFATDETAQIILSHDENEIERLAFTHWARSSVGREGYSCKFLVLNARWEIISRFGIRGQEVDAFADDDSLMSEIAGEVRVREVGSGVNALKVYTGMIPITTRAGRLSGYAHVTVAAGPQSVFRGEAPAVLRTTAQDDLRTFYRPILTAEYAGGELRSASEPLPIGYRLPRIIHHEFDDARTTSLWCEEVINGSSVESFYIRRTLDTIIGLSLPSLGAFWHLFNLVKILVYSSVLLFLVFASYSVVRWVGGKGYSFVFRDKLLIALLVTAFVPITILTIYGRIFARERIEEPTSTRLAQETAAVSAQVIRSKESIGRSPEIGRLNVPQTAQMADLGTDFNLYIGSELAVTTRPELYEAGILDTRLSGVAYAEIMLNGERFHVETENVGLQQYAVGYRPLISDDHRIAGIVSVPTLYRQDELSAELARQNAIVFGLYALVLLSVVIVAPMFANRIAAPIHGLTEATKRVSQGDLNVQVGFSNADGEVGELIRSFERMTKDLERNRKELIRYERELAWKEMAKQVAHEIKNPLTPMKLSLQHLRQTYRDKVANFEQVFEDVSKTIIDQIDALSRIATEFSRFARMPKPALERCQLNPIVMESVQLFAQHRNVTFELDLGTPSPIIRADREELRRAFINILRNSIQAMDNNGRLAIRSLTHGSAVTIRIEDSGPGIPDEIKHRLFEPNFSTKTDGMGLGLPIVKKTIDDLGGTMHVTSTMGHGTTVVITIPQSEDPQ